MSHPVEFESLPFGGKFKIGIVRLAAPRTLNALSMDMIALIKLQLELWQEDPHVAAIWLEGDGTKGFCAGGNVVDVYRSLAESDDGGAFSYRYFRSEYQLDYLLSTYSKPVVCWGNGFVMGGGMGLFMASDYRIATPTSRFAMPEIKIGLYPDVGASHFLNQLPEHYARFLALTAYQVNATDACELGLATHYVCDESKRTILKAIATSTMDEWNLDRAKTVISNALYRCTMSDDLPLLKPELLTNGKAIERLMSGNIANIHQAMKSYNPTSNAMAKARKNFLSGSPLSAHLIIQQLEWGKGQPLQAVFDRETVLSVNCSVRGDFLEGVRALLVDKDQRPYWKYRNVLDVPPSIVASFFHPATNVDQMDRYAENLQ
ncbi:enoyl-CoA hydratase/isomerase family protein [Marinomonas piezotolerans]|uniref:3-hydroxyisobutyryl-CoA hydrolase n=1 Tax=Marinomonas piezotolerans TaxID=2213058 RepID=A0A370U6L6_9GAMM|nr:enoyl-CoA hydratase/isomerase family protein [Marinomonas piezotolerans]RDL43408.1 enoyl-CoA hydratase/isomerase family protein [Marinomonas piezotolerans]